MQTETHSTGGCLILLHVLTFLFLYGFYSPFKRVPLYGAYRSAKVRENQISKREETADLMQGGHERGRRTCAPTNDRTQFNLIYVRVLFYRGLL